MTRPSESPARRGLLTRGIVMMPMLRTWLCALICVALLLPPSAALAQARTRQPREHVVALPSGDTTRSGRWFRAFQLAWIVTGFPTTAPAGEIAEWTRSSRSDATGRCQTTWRTLSDVRASPGSAKLTMFVGVIRVHLPGAPPGTDDAAPA